MNTQNDPDTSSNTPKKACHRLTPCADCPWRTDVPTGKFPVSRFQTLASTAYDMSTTQFACHKSPAGKEYACAGFLLSGSAHNLGVRIGIMRDHILLSRVHSEYPLFENYRDMAIANGVDPHDPVLKQCRLDTAIKP